MAAADVWNLAATSGRLSMVHSVLMFCPQFRPIVGGAERQAEKLAAALSRRGVRVTVLTPHFVRNSPLLEDDGGVVIHRFRLFDLCRLLPGIRGLGPLNLLLMRIQLGRAIKRHLNGVDVVHMSIAAPMSAFAMRAAQGEGVPVICKVATTGDKTDLGELSRIGLGGLVLARSMVRNLDRWIATTQAVRESLLGWSVANERIVLIPNGVDLLPSAHAIREANPARRFLYLGRLSSNSQRDVSTLIRSFDRLANELTDAELSIVGDGNLFQETTELVRSTRHRNRIRMPGEQRPEEWLQWADCFVLPSRYEGLSNALLEAMASGLPCIANDIPSNREVLGDGAAGTLVPIGDEDALHAAMLRIATDPAIARAVGRAGLDRVVMHYAIDSVAEKYIHLYEELSKRRTK